MIANNKGRKEKKLWTENQKGELVHFKQYDTEYDEADGVVSRINFLAMREYSIKTWLFYIEQTPSPYF